MTIKKSQLGIKKFYEKKTLLITGSLGFCGRVLLEKILRSFPEIDCIYLLIRRKGTLSAKKRLQRLFDSKLFSFHSHKQDQLKKVIVFEADIRKPSFGLSLKQEEEIQNNVQIIFHLAASVKFNASFRTNFECNVLGTQNVLNFAHKCKKIKVLLHLSTAYSNCNLEKIEEKFYNMEEDVDITIHKITNMSNEQLAENEQHLLQNRPNSYIFTKSLAEQLLLKHKGDLCITIARPAIVSPSVAEPAPGWIDNLNGLAGFSIVTSLGIAQTTNWSFDKQLDCFPVDFLGNALLAIVVNQSINQNDQIRIFNLVSTPLKPVDNYELLCKGKELMEECPSLYVLRPPTVPPKVCRMSMMEFEIKKFFYHVVFAYFIDFFLFLIGRKRIMLQAVQKMHFAMDLMRFFALRDWRFTCDHLVELIDQMSEQERIQFDFDIRPQDPVEVSRNIWLGIRRYLLRESDDTIPYALLK